MNAGILIYKDLVNAIKILEADIDVLKMSLLYYESEMTALAPHDISSIKMDGMPKGNVSPHTLDYCYEKVKGYKERLEGAETYLNNLKEKKKEYDEIFDDLKGLEWKVAKLKYVDGMSLQEIADTLGYSLIHIKHISQRAKRNFYGTQNDNVI